MTFSTLARRQGIEIYHYLPCAKHFTPLVSNLHTGLRDGYEPPLTLQMRKLRLGGRAAGPRLTRGLVPEPRCGPGSVWPHAVPQAPSAGRALPRECPVPLSRHSPPVPALGSCCQLRPDLNLGFPPLRPNRDLYWNAPQISRLRRCFSNAVKAGLRHNKRQKHHQGVNRIPWPLRSMCQHLFFSRLPGLSSLRCRLRAGRGGRVPGTGGVGPGPSRPRLRTDAGLGKLRKRQPPRDAFLTTTVAHMEKPFAAASPRALPPGTRVAAAAPGTRLPRAGT